MSKSKVGLYGPSVDSSVEDLFNATTVAQMEDIAMSMSLISVSQCEKFVDPRAKALLEEWSDFPAMQSYIRAVLTGDHTTLVDAKFDGSMAAYAPTMVRGLINGMETQRIGLSNKVRVGDKDIPLEWFSLKGMSAIQHKIRLYRKSSGHVNAPMIPDTVYSKGDFLGKCVALCGTPASRHFWTARIETLMSTDDYGINACIDGPDLLGPTAVHKYMIKEDHAAKGFFRFKAEDTPFTAYTTDENGSHSVVCFEDPKKAAARDGKLSITPHAVPYGSATAFIFDDVPTVDIAGTYLPDWLVSGAGLVHSEWLETRGPSRMVSASGLKCVTGEMPNFMKDAFMDVDLVLSKASFKSGLNGIHQLLTGKSLIETNGMTAEEIATEASAFKEVRYVRDVLVEGYTVVLDDLKATDLLSLYGLSLASEDSLLMLGGKSSYYLWAIEEVGRNPSFDLVGDIIDKLKSGELVYGTSSINIKSQEFIVADYSHGRKVGQDWMTKVLTQTIKGKMVDPSVKEVMDISSGLMTYEVYNETHLAEFADSVWEGIFVNPGVYDPEDLRPLGRRLAPDAEDGIFRLELLLEGHEASWWKGLLHGGSKIFTVGGQKLYIPSGATMRKYIHKEDGSNRVMFSGPAQEFMNLITSFRNKGTDWKLKSINHHNKLQSQLMGKNMDNFRVGGGHFTMLPAPWLDLGEIAMLNKRTDYLARPLSVSNGSRVTFSKMPVLFDSAICDVTIQNGLPRAHFGEVSERMIVAMRNLMYCNLDLMILHQNDTDGDMGRISLTGGVLPVFTGLAAHLEEWAIGYADGEYDMKLVAKAPKAYTVDAINSAIWEAVEAKRYVGMGTTSLETMSSVFQMAVREGAVRFSETVMLRNAYAAGLQSAISGMKHEGTGADFKKCSANDLLYGPSELGADPRGEFKNLLRQFLTLPEDCMSELMAASDSLFEWWDSVSGGVESPLRSRRVSSISSVSLLKQGDLEDDFKVLDAKTNGFVNGVEAAQPMRRLFKTSNPHAVKVMDEILIQENGVKLYKDKYVLLGQQLWKYGEGTTLGDLHRTWRDLSK